MKFYPGNFFLSSPSFPSHRPIFQLKLSLLLKISFSIILALQRSDNSDPEKQLRGKSKKKLPMEAEQDRPPCLDRPVRDIFWAHEVRFLGSNPVHSY